MYDMLSVVLIDPRVSEVTLLKVGVCVERSSACVPLLAACGEMSFVSFNMCFGGDIVVGV